MNKGQQNLALFFYHSETFSGQVRRQFLLLTTKGHELRILDIVP